MLTVGAGLLALALPALAAGQVVWGSCPQDLGADGRCGWAQVPLDPARAAGPTLEIRVIVLPATGEAKEEPVLFFPGGPGQATTALIPMATQVFAAARETRDFVFIGQRGAGESAPLGCDIDVAGNPHWAFGHLWVVEEIRRCRAEVPAGRDPRLFTTREYVADIDAVLDDLEYGRVLLWGGSGGTRTATAYLREHPDRVVGAVLDGVVPIDYALPLRFAATLEEAWRRVVADCGAQPECAAAFPDLAGDLNRLGARLETAPASVTIQGPDDEAVDVRMGRGDLSYAIRGILYNPGATASLPAQVHRAATTGDLTALAQALYDRSAVMLGGVISVGLHLASYCAEDVPRIDPGRVAEETSGTLMGPYLVEEYSAACVVWTAEPLEAEWYRDFTSEVPVLMLSGHYDPSTPPGTAEEVRKSFPNSRHLIVRDAGHGAGFGCGRSAVTGFLTNPVLDGIRLECEQRPIRFEVP